MKNLLILLLLSSAAFGQIKPNDSLVKSGFEYITKNEVNVIRLNRPAPVVEYEVVQTVTVGQGNQYLVHTKLFTLRQGERFFEIFATWEGLCRQKSETKYLKEKQRGYVEKELKQLGFYQPEESGNGDR